MSLWFAFYLARRQAKEFGLIKNAIGNGRRLLKQLILRSIAGTMNGTRLCGSMQSIKGKQHLVYIQRNAMANIKCKCLFRYAACQRRTARQLAHFHMPY